MKKIIELNNISKSFDGEKVLDNLNLFIKENEFLTLLGPSGCGKTTMLRIIGGFIEADEGEIIFDGKSINDLKSNERQLNTVFQKYALFPHLNVYDNIAFGPRNKKISESEIKELVTDALKMVKLSGYEKRKVDLLSGGQQQRIAIARAIVNKPKVLLLDEPLGALDLKLRQDMQYELKDMQKKLGITFVFVTHDQEEALTMSDTIVVLDQGYIQQIGSPEDIYNEPKNRFVANFIGESNIIRGTYTSELEVSFLGEKFDCVDSGFKIGEEVDVVVRPEDFDVVDEKIGKIKGIVDDSVFKGVHYELCILVNGVEYIVHTLENRDVGSTIYLNVDPHEIHLMKVNHEVA
jgi:spermidine/putrescine transport system ATP-binding protein